MPNKTKGRTLIFAAHMDDEALSAGGLIQDRVSRGWPVHVVFLSGRVYDYGRESEYMSAEDEKEDCRTSCGILGVTSMNVHLLPEGEPYKMGYYTPLEVIERELAEFRPTEVLVPSLNDLNQDHRHYAEVCQIALRPANLGTVRRILAMQAFDQTLHEPDFFVPMSSAMLTTKLAAVAAYRRERREGNHPRSPRNIEAMHRIWGSKVDVEFAEAYDLLLWKD